MSLSFLIEKATIWFGWGGLALLLLTLLSFIIKWGIRFRLVGATIFSLLLSISCWAFSNSYSPPIVVDGAIYAPVVYDNGFDLIVVQANQDFPEEAIEPTLQQIANNLKGAGRNRSKVNIRLRKIIPNGEGISKPIIIGQIIKDLKTQPSKNIL